MSNAAVGQLYKTIIDAVIEQSRSDFEEHGSLAEIGELQQQWQNRLSAGKRAVYPWDPQPLPPPLTAITPTLPSNALKTEAGSRNGRHSLSPNLSQQNALVDGVKIKQEPGTFDTPNFLNLPQDPRYAVGQNAQYPMVGGAERAAQLVQQRYGNQGNASVSALQAAGMSLPGVQQTPHGLQLPGQGQPRYPMQHPPQQYRTLPTNQQQQQQQQMLQQPKQEGYPSSLSQAQTDGATDATQQWAATVEGRHTLDQDETMSTAAVDGMISRHAQEMFQRLEAGGLMVPLDEQRQTQGVKRKLRAHKRTASARHRSSASSSAGPSRQADEVGPSLARFDGGDDTSPEPDIDDDEDAINSDLDDSDDGLDNGIETSMEGDVILCLYDKVQRVKNKWKCTLKDGVVTVDNKDYVFHKANGEFEW